jgi:Ca-activated chloride channel homolog
MKISLLLILVLFSNILFAGSTGKIAGKVTDKNTGDDLVGVNILINVINLGASTDVNGLYTIINVPPGTYTVEALYVGYASIKIIDVEVIADSTTKLNLQLMESALESEMIVVTAQRAVIMQDMMMSASVIVDGGISTNFVPYNTEEYDKIDENTFYDVVKSPLSTFAADVDAASYANARRFIMQDQLPYKDAVRTEEFINYFSYDYKQPTNEHPLSINMEYSDCPWNDDHKLIHIGLRGKNLNKEEQKPSNLVFLLDVSGSMDSPKKLPLLKRSFKLLVEQLSPKDKIAIVVYAGSAGLVLPSTSGEEKGRILKALDQLQAGGSTAGGAGIQLAYKVAKENFIEEGNNRVILATDGDFNIGISSTSELVRFIETKRDEGIFLTVLGFGTGNYKDNRLQELADRGNGNHAYIDNILEAKKVLVNEITSTLYTIAKDVKIQVEFNPIKIKSYRLVGYENRMLDDKDFEDDTKDAGEIGAGHTVTALYEVVLADEKDLQDKNELKYQEMKVKEVAFNTNEILTVRIKYKDPEEEKSREISKVLTGDPIRLDNSSDNFRFSAAVAQFAMILRDSEFKESANIESVLDLAESATGKDVYDYRDEFLDLVERVEILLDE